MFRPASVIIIYLHTKHFHSVFIIYISIDWIVKQMANAAEIVFFFYQPNLMI